MKKIFLIVCLFLTFSISGCKVETAKACATNYPVYYLIQKIGGSFVEPCNLSKNTLIQRGQISDTFNDDLNDSDILFYISGLEPYFTIYQDDISKAKFDKVDLASASAIYKFQRVTTSTLNNQSVSVESPYYEGEAFTNVDIYEKDVTIWMDPNSMMSMAKTIADYFINNYPENAEIFQDNYNKLEVDLAQLDAAFQTLRNENKMISFVSMTPNFGNWQKSYGFKVYPVSISKYGALPSAEQLEIIKMKIIQDDVKYIAHEENLPADMEELFLQLESELGLIPISLNNISSITESSMQNNKDYLSLMYENLAQLESVGG